MAINATVNKTLWFYNYANPELYQVLQNNKAFDFTPHHFFLTNSIITEQQTIKMLIPGKQPDQAIVSHFSGK